MGLSKLLRSAPARPTWLGCQSAWLYFRSVLTAKDLKFRFHTSALPWLQKTWCSASTFPLCLDWQRSEVPRPHFRSALTAKNVKFRFRIRTSALPLLPYMWSSAPALPLCLYWQRSEVPLSALVLLNWFRCYHTRCDNRHRILSRWFQLDYWFFELANQTQRYINFEYRKNKQ